MIHPCYSQVAAPMSMMYIDSASSSPCSAIPSNQLPLYPRNSIFTTVDVLKHPKSRQMFTSDEDNLLMFLVSIYGTNQWNLISKSMGNRTIRQCRDRYKHYLSKRGPIVECNIYEDKLLIEKHREYGQLWSKIVQFFPNRTETNLKTRFEHLTKGNNEEISEPEQQPSELIESSSKSQNISSEVEEESEEWFTFPLDDFDCNSIIDWTWD